MAIYCHLTWLNWVLELAMTSLLCRHDPTVLIECLQNSGYFNIVHIAKSIFPAYLSFLDAKVVKILRTSNYFKENCIKNTTFYYSEGILAPKRDSYSNKN